MPSPLFALCRRRLPLRALAAALVVVLSACQVTIGIGVDVKGDGSGSVTVTAQLDQQAASTVPNLAQDLRTSDLIKAGWRVEGPKPGPGGTVAMTASKPFTNPTEAKAVLAELSGGSGPFRDLEIVRKPSLFATRTTFKGSVDLTCGLRCFADPQLQKDLGGTPDLGLDPATLQRGAGVILNQLFLFEVAVHLPGTVQSSNAPVQLGNGAKWPAKLGDTAALVATTRAWNVSHIAAAAVMAALLLAAVVVLVVYLLRRRRRRRPKRTIGAHSPKGGDDAGKAPATPEATKKAVEVGAGASTAAGAAPEPTAKSPVAEPAVVGNKSASAEDGPDVPGEVPGGPAPAEAPAAEAPAAEAPAAEAPAAEAAEGPEGVADSQPGSSRTPAAAPAGGESPGSTPATGEAQPKPESDSPADAD